MRMALRGAIWFGAYVAVVVVPLIFAAIGIVDDHRGFWREFAVALGFVGLSMMGLQFVLVARLRTVAAPFGEDALVHLHRYLGYVGTLLIVAHPVLLIVLVDRSYLERVNPFTAPWAGRFGTLSILCLLVIAVTSIWRLVLRISYEVWQGLHLILSTVAIAAAVTHVELIHHYVGQPWKRFLWAVMALAFLGLFGWVRIVRPMIRMRRPWRISAVAAEPGGVSTVTLQPVGHGGFAFAPGQFGWLSIHRSPFALTQHPFSFSSNGDDSTQIQMSIKELGDFTTTIRHMVPGTVAYIDGPHGVFSPDRYPGEGCVFLAGGVGIGPIRSMLRTFAARGDRRPCYLFFGANRAEDLTYHDEIVELANQLVLAVIVAVAEPHDDWPGERGYVDLAMLTRHLPANHQALQYFICGPGVMQDAMEDALARLGVAGDRVHTERFNFV